METKDTASLISIAGPWPIAITLATYLPVGDLINLARTSVLLRAALHGFLPPSTAELQDKHQMRPRPALRIGSHQTAYWKQLKQAAPFICASPTHTKGSNPRPCRYCSTPICEACIVRDSFAKGGKNTFKNRCRFLCKDCWNSDNPHRRSRFKADQHSQDGWSRYNFAPGKGEFCACTNKDDSWVCISCKEMQNTEANASGFKLCFGTGCSARLEEDRDRRCICLWCDRPMLRGRASIESRLAFDQKMQDVRAKRRLSIEGIRKQQKLDKMSRRELRGDEAVAQDPLADAPQFVRHLDTVNYERFVPRQNTPSGEQVYQSKLGRWMYSRGFLMKIGQCCKRLPKRSDKGAISKVLIGDSKSGVRVLSSEKKKAKRQGQDDDTAWPTPHRKTHGSNRAVRSIVPAEFLHLRRSFFFPKRQNAAGEVETEEPELETPEDTNDDHALALALQTEFDREVAESLEAEAFAEAAEEFGFTDVEDELEEISTNGESSFHPFAVRNSTTETGYASRHEGNDGALSRSRSRSKVASSQHQFDLEMEDVDPFWISDGLITPDQPTDLEIAGDELSNLASAKMHPQADVDESGERHG